MLQRTCELQIRGYAPKPQKGRALIHEYNGRERLVRGLQIGGLTWLVAFVGILIPVAHFLIVPGGLILGVFLFFRRLRQEVVPIEVTGTCPDCGTEQKFDLASGSWHPPEGVTCRHCLRNLKLVEQETER